MRGWRATIGAVLVLLTPFGCDQPTPAPVTPEPAAPAASRPASTEPTFEEKMAALSPYAMPGSSTRHSTSDDVAPTTAPAADPLATPEGTLQFVLAASKEGRWRDVRTASLEQLTREELERRTVRMRRALLAGTMTPIDKKQQDDLALFIICAEDARHAKSYTMMLLANRFDQWKVQIGPANPLLLTLAERQALPELMAWAERRFAELEGRPVPSGQPAAAGSATDSTTPALPALPAAPGTR